MANITIHDDGEGTFTSVEVHVELEFRTDTVVIEGYGKDVEMAAKNVIDELYRFKGQSERKSLVAIALIDSHEDIPNLKDYKEQIN